jgi:hypothetical protein
MAASLMADSLLNAEGRRVESPRIQKENHMPDITTLAAWGEFLGGIAVVVSLIYLASQIRQNSKLLKASTAGVTLEANNQMSILVAQDPELSRIYFDGLADPAALFEPDQRRFNPLLGVQITGFQQQFRLARDGSLGSGEWADVEQAQRWLAQQSGMKHWWLQWRNLYGGDFRDHMDGLIRETARTNEIPYMDLLDRFKGERYIDLWVHPSDQHPNHREHAIAAAAMADFLIDRGLLETE